MGTGWEEDSTSKKLKPLKEACIENQSPDWGWGTRGEQEGGLPRGWRFLGANGFVRSPDCGDAFPSKTYHTVHFKHSPGKLWRWVFDSTQRPTILEQTIVALGRTRERGSGAGSGDGVRRQDLSGHPTSRLCRLQGSREGQERKGGSGYISGLSKQSDCPELSVCKDEGDIIGIRASAEPGNEWRFKYQDAKFTKGIGEREGGGRRGGECGE